jgi:hypothetical protein
VGLGAVVGVAQRTVVDVTDFAVIDVTDLAVVDVTDLAVIDLGLGTVVEISNRAVVDLDRAGIIVRGRQRRNVDDTRGLCAADAGGRDCGTEDNLAVRVPRKAVM